MSTLICVDRQDNKTKKKKNEVVSVLCCLFFSLFALDFYIDFVFFFISVCIVYVYCLCEPHQNQQNVISSVKNCYVIAGMLDLQKGKKDRSCDKQTYTKP